MATQIDAITEARNNLTSIDKEIDAIMEQITTLQAKVDNLRKTKTNDEAFIRIVEMREQGKDLSQLFNDRPQSGSARGQRASTSGTRAPRGNSVAVIEAARELIEKEGSATGKDIVKYATDKGVTISGKDDAARERNVYLAIGKAGGFNRNKGMLTLAE